jgi:hypothetical protein
MKASMSYCCWARSRAAGWVLAAALLASCTPSPTLEETEQKQAEAALLVKLREGQVQAEGLLASIDEAMAAAAAALGDPELAEARLELDDRLGAARDALAPFAEIVLSEDEIQADFGQQDSVRKEMIAAADDAQIDLIAASQVAADLSLDDSSLADLAGQVDLCARDAQDMVESLGGSITLEGAEGDEGP